MAKDYIERRHDSFYLIGSRIRLSTIVWEFQQGSSPESIRSNYDTLSLEEVYGAITFYLANKAEAEQDLADRRREEEEFSKKHPCPPHLKEKLERAREQMLARRS